MHLRSFALEWCNLLSLRKNFKEQLPPTLEFGCLPMSFLQCTGTESTHEQLGVQAENGVELAGKLILLDLNRLAALLPSPTEPSHANYPPTITFQFFLYGNRFTVGHSFRSEGRKNPREIDVFTIEVNRALTYFKRRRIEALCREAMTCYLGDSYWGRPYELVSQVIPRSKREMIKIERVRTEVLRAMEKKLDVQ